MGTYLNPNNHAFLGVAVSGRYVDKTMLMGGTNRRIGDPARRTHASFIGYVTGKVCTEFERAFQDIAFDEEAYLAFLNSLFKNAELAPAVSLAYRTGILPIMKDKIQSKLNTFDEITMLDADDFAEFTGFTTEEVRRCAGSTAATLSGARAGTTATGWGGGYEIYTTSAVISAVPRGKFKPYWSGTSTYAVVADKIRLDFAGTREDVIAMLGGGKSCSWASTTTRTPRRTSAGLSGL